MKIVYFGNNPRGVVCLEALCDAGFTPAAVVIHHQASCSAGTVHGLAVQREITVYDPKRVNAPEFINELKTLQPDLLILTGYNQILRHEILQIPPKGAINLHGGYLPYYRGGSPINWQILKGERTGGCAIIYVDEGIDTGDIIAQELYDIHPDATAGDVIQQTLDIFPRLLVDVVRQIEQGTVRAVKQDLTVGAYYCKRYPQDGQIFWDTMTAAEVHNLIRALHGPNLPGAFTFLNGKKIVVLTSKLLTTEIKGVPGRIALKQDGGVVVTAKDRGLLLLDLLVNDQPIAAKKYFKICGMTLESHRPSMYPA